MILSLSEEKQHIVEEHVQKVFKKSGLVVFPTDTVYGLLADAKSEQAIKKLIQFKERVPGKAISVFVSDFAMMKDYVEAGRHEPFIKELLPGPYTIVLSAKHKTPKLLESERETLGVRIPRYERITEMVKKFGSPLTATSANLSGDSAHYSVTSLLKSLSKQKQQLIDLIVDAGQLPRNKPSTVVDLTTPHITILRQGDSYLEGSYASYNVLQSSSPGETKSIARNLVVKIQKEKEKPLIFIIEGELGAGKTVFVQGIGEYFGLRDIISPTFVVYYEYEVQKSSWKKFIHFDLYNVQEDEEFGRLGIKQYLTKGNILCFEWGEKAGKIYEALKTKGTVIRIKIEYTSEQSRRILISIKINHECIKQ